MSILGAPQFKAKEKGKQVAMIGSLDTLKV